MGAGTVTTDPDPTHQILYPKGAKFDMDYYLSTHMPLAQKHWAPLGMTSYKVLKFGDDQPYSVQATLEWPSVDAFVKATQAPATKEILGDVPNFSDKQPTIIPGEIVGTS
ncbi:hypothetical protein MBLNU459_g8379t2 [Dothideomycetes sp. NU459]